MMNLRQLEAFRATMRAGSITEAGASLNLSQPSISRLISDLERDIGFDLFTRSGRGLTPTIEGRTFYNGVENMFFGIDRLEELATSIRTTTGGKISIGTIQSVATIELPAAIGEFAKHTPETHFMVQTRNTPAILEAVQLRQVDLGIVGRNPPYHGVEVLFEEAIPYVCLIPEQHELADRAGALDLEEIAEKQAFVTFGGAFPDEMMSIDAALSLKLQQRSRLSATNMPVAASLVRETGAFAIVDPFSAEQAVHMGGVVFRPIRQDLIYHIGLVTSQREHLSRNTLAFVESLKERLLKRIGQVRKFS